MGGDFAPEATVLGSILAQKELPADVIPPYPVSFIATIKIFTPVLA